MTHLTRVTMVCTTCGHKARRDLACEAGSRGTHETQAEPASCPRGHGPLVRADGVRHDWYHGVWGGHLVDLSGRRGGT